MVICIIQPPLILVIVRVDPSSSLPGICRGTHWLPPVIFPHGQDMFPSGLNVIFHSVPHRRTLIINFQSLEFLSSHFSSNYPG